MTVVVIVTKVMAMVVVLVTKVMAMVVVIINVHTNIDNDCCGMGDGDSGDG